MRRTTILMCCSVLTLLGAGLWAQEDATSLDGVPLCIDDALPKPARNPDRFSLLKKPLR